MTVPGPVSINWPLPDRLPAKRQVEGGIGRYGRGRGDRGGRRKNAVARNRAVLMRTLARLHGAAGNGNRAAVRHVDQAETSRNR